LRGWGRGGAANRAQGCASDRQNSISTVIRSWCKTAQASVLTARSVASASWAERAIFACGRVRAAFSFDDAGDAVVLSREIDQRAVLCNAVAWLREGAVAFLQLLAAPATLKVAFGIGGEFAARKRSVQSKPVPRHLNGRDPRLRSRPGRRGRSQTKTASTARAAVMAAVVAINADIRRMARAWRPAAGW
jgi:hypothetical protein